jgi:hypothetical protein
VGLEPEMVSALASVLAPFTLSIAALKALTPSRCCFWNAALMFARACSGEFVVKPLPPESPAAANERMMKTEVGQALELIRQKAPTILLDTIPNIHERRIIDYIICFAIDQSNPRKLWESICKVTIDERGIGATKAQIDNESDMLFNFVAKRHFPELTDPQIDELYRSFEEAIIKRIW